jgi:hypothetical protein
MPEENKIDPTELERAMASYSRDPFRKALTDYLQGNPSLDDIKSFAKKYPDRHAQSVAIFARLSGYHEKVQVDIDNNIHVWIKNASDSELLAKVAELESQLRTIDVTPNQTESREVVRTKTTGKRGNE